jgi:hypothetical protein
MMMKAGARYNQAVRVDDERFHQRRKPLGGACLSVVIAAIAVLLSEDTGII